VIFRLDPSRPDAPFPDVELAETEPDGLLAVGGDLEPARLLNAYRRGIFPWYSEGQPILWWSPDPRTVLFPERMKVSRSLRKTLRKRHFEVSVDQAFPEVVRACAGPRRDSEGTWILPEMVQAYVRLHGDGAAHSVEVWQEERLVGGLYGIALGQVFFGESMFSAAGDASKVALVHLTSRLRDWQYRMIDCQVYSPHLLTLGAEQIPRTWFSRLLAQWTWARIAEGAWLDPGRSLPLPPTAPGS